jgi:hypothetical protein
MTDPCSCHELNGIIGNTPRPFHVNLNKIANPSKARKTNVGSAPASVRFTNPNTAISDQEPCPEPDVAAAPLSSSPPKTASHPLSKIAHMVTKGIQVIKVHNNPSIFNDACAERVIWMDERFDVLYCAPEKGDATKKRFPVEDILEVQNLGNRRDRATRFAVVHKRGILTLEVSSTKARDAVASNLHHLIQDQQTKRAQRAA